MIRNVLIVTDGTVASAPAISFGAELAGASKALIQLVHVVDLPARGFEVPLTTARLQQLRKRLDASVRRAEVAVSAQANRHLPKAAKRTVLVRIGPWSRTVLEVARQIGAHLIVVPRTNTIAVATDELVRSAWRPVVVVPAPVPRRRGRDT